jgi:mono/diheme cytochrome c family protein
MNMINIATLVAALSLPLTANATAMLAGDADKGRQTHDQLCLACHKSMTGGQPDMLYTRADRRVSSLDALIAQVGRCNKFQNLGLDDDSMDDIVKYLNETFYRFDN